MGLRKFLRRQRHKRTLQATEKYLRGQKKFLLAHPGYSMGTGSYGMPIVHDLDDGTTLTIGAYTSIADEVHIFLGGQHRPDWVSMYPFPAFMDDLPPIENFRTSRGSVTIGNDVWLASGCTILSGVSVGDGAVVAARALVARDVPAYAVVAGNPARIIKWRFPEDVRTRLQKTCWWNWSVDEIRKVVPLLCSAQIEDFLHYAESRPAAPGDV